MQIRNLFSLLASAAALAVSHYADAVASSTAFCAQDVKECPDGSFVGRDPNNGCEFFPCEKFCTLDVKECPDGSYVGRDPNNGCAFFPCEMVCTQDVKECPDGSFVGRDPMNSCAFYPCQEMVCTQDVKECPDGSFVGRDPKNGCAFFSCKKLDCKICPGGFFDGCNTCTCGKRRRFPSCTKRACRPELLQPQTCNKETPSDACTQDVSTCPDGSAVGRDPANGCKFFPCPPKPIGCDTCPCGYNDGCNDCQCARDGSISCTERACVWQGIPSCLPCS